MAYLRHFALIFILALVSQAGVSFADGKDATLEYEGDLSPNGSRNYKHARQLLDNYRGRASHLEGARVALTQVIDENPSYAPAYREFARYVIMRGHIRYLRFREGTLEAAEALLNRATEIDPDYAEAYVLYGHLYRLMGRYEAAMQALDKADRLGSTSPWLHINWADIHIDEGRHEEAAKRYREVLKSGGDDRRANTAAYEGLIKYFKSTDNLDAADRTYREAIAAEPENAWNYGNYAEFLLCTKDQYDLAIARAREALKRLDYGVGRLILASALYRKWAQFVVNEERPQDGRHVFQEAESIYPDVWKLAADVQRCPPMIVVQRALQITLPARP